jgi:hypothetical protein
VRKLPLPWGFMSHVQADVFSMTHHVERVAFLEKAGKGA